VRKAAIPMTCALLLSAHSAAAADPPADCPKRLVEKLEVDPATGKETAAGRSARQELEMVVNVVVSYESCAGDVPGFADTFGAAYREWRERNPGPIARYDRDATARRYVECGLQHERRRIAAESSAGRTEKSLTCNNLIGPGIENFARRNSPR
jgi:hypothetical protein